MGASGTQAETVMVVEDDANLAELVATELEIDGFHVETAQDGQVALDKMKRHPPDVIVLDLRLPGIDGLQVVRSCRENPETQRVPIIVTSGSHDALCERDLESLVYLQKPYSMDILIALVEDAVDSV